MQTSSRLRGSSRNLQRKTSRAVTTNPTLQRRALSVQQHDLTNLVRHQPPPPVPLSSPSPRIDIKRILHAIIQPKHPALLRLPRPLAPINQIQKRRPAHAHRDLVRPAAEVRDLVLDLDRWHPLDRVRLAAPVDARVAAVDRVRGAVVLRAVVAVAAVGDGAAAVAVFVAVPLVAVAAGAAAAAAWEGC